jgi:tetratricopeptide (TPR) repeat protein
MNQSLKKLIEENQRLLMQNEDLQEKFTALRGEKTSQEERLRALAAEKENLLRKSEKINAEKVSYEGEIKDLKKQLKVEKEADLGETAATASVPSSVNASEMIQMFSQLMEENEIIRRQSAKVHNDLAYLFLEQGRRAAAAEEFGQAASLMPDDASAHYNLALICEEYLYDFPVAIRHYKKYLELVPDAADAATVRKKISRLQAVEENRIDANVNVKNGGRSER